MKSWGIEQRGTLSNLKCLEAAKPVITADKVLVRVKAAGLNLADLKVIKGGVGRFLHSNKFPLFMGYDFSGIVESIGAGVSSFVQGDEVYGFLPYDSSNAQGAYSEYVLVSPAEIARRPDNISFEDAASLPTTAGTALTAVRDVGEVKRGMKVFINGASGGVGCYAVQIAKILGAEVVGSCSQEKMEFVNALGARAVDYRTTSITALSEKFDLIFDAASTSWFRQCARSLVKGGKFITLLPTPALILGFIESFFVEKSCHFVYGKSKTVDLLQLGSWIEENQMVAKVEQVYPLKKLPEALGYLQSGKTKGKLVVTVS
ncbi:NADPH:quinone reductase-like Zn-dependent oxidoreductase [Oxalobacteraceae bacterium GrIS 1.11]